MVVSCGHSFGGLMLRRVIERVSMTISCSLQKLCPIIASLKRSLELNMCNNNQALSGCRR
jgi:hypothetical protein